jgi:hypothetical protein
MAIRSATAHAHFFLGRYDEAASWAAMALQDNPDFQPGLRVAAASNAMAGYVALLGSGAIGTRRPKCLAIAKR